MVKARIGSLVAFSCLLSAIACGGSAASSFPTPQDEGADAVQDESDLTSAKLTLRIPLLDRDGKLLSQHNAVLAAAKLGTFPDSVEIVANAKGVPTKDAGKAWDDASALVDKANEKLKLEIEMRTYGEPMEYETKDPKTSICYRGNPLYVVDMIGNLTDRVFSDQLSIHGWRYRSKKVLDSNMTPANEAAFPSLWKNWRGKGAAILIVTASSDDGGEINPGLLYKCQ